jgi:gluconate 5-dehydrogenase
MDFTAAFSLSGEVALITGGGSGLGLGMARCFVASGARVVLVGRDEQKLANAVAELGPQAIYEVCDVRQLETLPHLLERAQQRHGPISILVNNAGTTIKKPAVETSDEEFLDIFTIHVRASFALARLAAKGMRSANGDRCCSCLL